MPNKSGRPYRPQMTEELSHYPESQKGGPVPVKNLGLAQDDWTRNSVIEAGSEATAEKLRKQRAAVQTVRDGYFNRRKQGTEGPHEGSLF